MSTASRPVHILTGFLGTGKTTLLNRLLSKPDFANTLVIINEFGEVPLDHHLIESSAETIVELSNGCLCCSIRGELVDTLLTLDTSRFARIIIETTGIADPLPIHQALTVQPVLARGLHAGSIIGVFDCTRGRELIRQHVEAKRQLALSDMVYISMQEKCLDIAKVQAQIRAVTPTAKIISSPDTILAAGIDGHSPSLRQPHDTGHGSGFVSLVLETDKAHPLSAITGFLHHLSGMYGEVLLRVKGFTYCPEHPTGPVLVQMSGPIVHEPVKLETWPDQARKTQLVVIGNDLDPAVVKSIFNGFFGNPEIDTPDKEAILDNPLSIPGI